METRARGCASPVGVLTVALAVAVAACALVFGAQPAAASPMPWCGNDVTAGDRLPDHVAGAQVHLIFAFPADGPDRFNELAPAIAGDIAAIDAWWRREDPTRTPRFDLFDFPDCGSPFGRLDISTVRLGRPAAAYDQATIVAASDAIYDDLKASPVLASQHAFKKYYVYYDGPATRMEDACAVSFGEPANIAFTFLQPPMPGCPPIDTGAGGFTAMVTAHELVHNLGGTGRATGAPHRCNGGHVCDAEADIIYGKPSFIPLFERVLDVGHDDYYAHSGSWFDVQDSPFLVHVGAPQHELAVRIDGNGRVRADLPGLVCPPACAAAWDTQTKVTLRATAGSGARFARWAGDCAGAYSRCQVTINRARNVAAQFVTSTTGSTDSPSTGTTKNWAPLARIVPLTRTSFEPGEQVAFASKSSDRDGSIVSQEWTFGDGGVATGATATHSFTTIGTFIVTLRVVDNRGAAKTATVSVSVKPSPPRAYAYGAYARSGDRTKLHFKASDNRSVTRLRVTVLRGRRHVLQRTLRPRVAKVDRSLIWRVPKRDSDYTWCVRAWDDRGYASERVCAPVKVF